MKYYSHYRIHDLFELQESLSGLSKSNRWVKLADRLPWAKIEKEYNKRLRNSHCGAGNKPARMVVGALIVKHVENLSDEKTIQAIQENPYMQYLLGLSKFTEKPVFVPELFVLIRKRLNQDFFNMLTLMLAEADGSKPKKEGTDEDGNDHGGTMKCDATCCDAEVRFKMYEQQKMMFDQKVRSCADHIISVYQPHLRPIVRGKAKAKVEFGAKIGACIVNGYTYVDHLCWDAYNESSDFAMQIELYRKRFGMLPREVQVDKIYLGKANRQYLKDNNVECCNRPLGRPPKEDNDRHAEEKRRAICERNEIEATFGTSKRVYRANDIRAKLDNTADTWIGVASSLKT